MTIKQLLEAQANVEQGRIQPVSLGWAISVTFGSQVTLRVHYFKRDEVCCDKTMEGKKALYRECCFRNCTKSW